MAWTLHRWTWLLEGPLFVGFVRSESLNRCRLYVPARAVWGAITAEASRLEAEGEPCYEGIGNKLKSDARFSYLYPAERLGDRWVTWLPAYRDGLGLCWQREDGRGEPVSDRTFRRRLLTTRLGTAIDPSSDAAADGSLRETECVSDRWRQADDREDNRVSYVGYVFTNSEEADKYTASVKRLFIGGDTRYGLGAMTRGERRPDTKVFGEQSVLGDSEPRIHRQYALAHTKSGADTTMIGALELLGGWDRGSLRSIGEDTRLWQPGSRGDGAASWTIEPEGTWKATEVAS